MERSSLAWAVPFVGREQEMAILRRRLDEALHGVGSIALLGGEPGIGKTRLSEQLAAEARGLGAQVLWGRCYEGEGAPSFWPWVQIIRSCARDCEPRLLSKQMGPGAADIAQVVPEVRLRLPDLASPPPLEPAQARFRFFDSVSNFLGSAARDQPLVLILDDLHWADDSSLLLLQFLARELHASPTLVIGTYRDTEVSREHPLAAALAELARVDHSERLLLAGLSAADVARFIDLEDDRPFSSALVETIARETEGNPFFVTQIVRLLNAEGRLHEPSTRGIWNLVVPATVCEVLGRRLDRLSPACHSVLTVAALLGREFRLTTLERTGDLARDALLDAIEEAVDARVIQPVPGTVGQYSFVHALMRETLYGDLGAATRARLHRQAGEALETLYAVDPDSHSVELAYHFTRAALGGGPDKALDYSRRAGDGALSLLAFEDAAAHYGRALEMLRLKEPLDRSAAFDLLLAMGDAWSRAGRTQRAQDACAEAANIARVLHSPERLARAALGFDTVQPGVGRVYTVRVGLLEEALALLDAGSTALRARVLGRLAQELYWSSSHLRREELSRQAVAMARDAGDRETLARALLARHWSICWPDTLHERLAITAELIPLAESLGDKELLLQAVHYSTADWIELGDIVAVKKNCDSRFISGPPVCTGRCSPTSKDASMRPWNWRMLPTY